MESTTAEDVANGIVSKNNRQTSQIQELQKEVSKLRKTIVEQDQKIEMLTKNQKNMNDRLRAQERYSRKDSVLIVNPPFNSRSVQDVTLETLKFFDKFLGVYLERPSIKACHMLKCAFCFCNSKTPTHHVQPEEQFYLFIRILKISIISAPDTTENHQLVKTLG